MHKRLIWIGTGILLFGGVCLAQQSAPATVPQAVPPAPQKHYTDPGRTPQNPRGRLTNSDVIKMVQSGLSEPTIISSIQSSVHAFDLSPEGLIALHRGGVSQRVLDVMMADGSVRTAPSLSGGGTQRADDLNPQPFPPRGINTLGSKSVSLQALKAHFTPGSLRVATGQPVKNGAVQNSAIIAVLAQQKQVADLEAGQILSSAGNNPTGAGPSMVGPNPAGARIGLSGRSNSNIRPLQQPSSMGVKSPNTTVCLSNVSIAYVNQKKTGVVFTPAPPYNVYTIAGCGFGPTPGKIYLQGGPGAFPAHGGKLNLIPTTWSERGIVAKLDPSIAHELDQKNISLVVETSSGVRTQSDGASFYAVRGLPYMLPSVPRDNVALWVADDPMLASPSGIDFGLSGCTAAVYRQGPKGSPGQDDYRLNLAPGFVVDSAQLLVSFPKANATDEGDASQFNVVPSQLQVNGNDIKVNVAYYPDGNYTMFFYGLKVWVNGPAGVNPFTGQ